MTPEAGTKTEIKQWVLANISMKVNHGCGLPRLIKKLRRGQRIFEIRKTRHLPHCMVGVKYYDFRFPFVHRLHACHTICLCEIIALLADLSTQAHDLTCAAREGRKSRL